MNRLIIIGNGFDIAHGLKTKYSDFLKFYWSQIKGSFKDKLVEFHSGYNTPICYSLDEVYEMQQRTNILQNLVHFKVTNNFFLELNQKYKENNWVDIETSYYEKLVTLFKKNQNDKIIELNIEFENVKKEFERYILSVVSSTENLSQNYMKEMAKLFLPIRNGQIYNNDFLNKLTHKVRDKFEDEMERIIHLNINVNSSIHVLNFNYTNTIECYRNVLRKNDGYYINNIHGIAGNNVVFGFGDERDGVFSELEGQNVNEYLRYMKSSSYLQNSKYYDLLNFIESENYIVEIHGHSCGLSDRTLLKTIFENENCLQIFLSYFKENNLEDNFFDLSLNISRHFDDKIMLRRKVANKEFSILLPQRTIE